MKGSLRLSGRLATAVVIILGSMIGCNRGMNEADRNALEKEIHVALPNNIELLSSEEGERDASYGYHIWIIYSKSRITLNPADGAVITSNYSLNDPAVLDEYVRNVVTNKRIARSVSSQDMSFEIAGYEYRFGLLKTDDGGVLVVERFKIRK